MKSEFDVTEYLNCPDTGKKVLGLAQREMIFKEGQLATTMYYVIQGEVKLSVVTNGGKEAILAILREGEIFGDTCLTQIQERSCSASARKESLVMQLDREVVLETMAREWALSEFIIKSTLRGTARVEQDLLEASTPDYYPESLHAA